MLSAPGADDSESGVEKDGATTAAKGAGLLGATLRLDPTMRNDVYSKFAGNFAPISQILDAHGAGVVVEVIYPATEKHVAKYRTQQPVSLVETAELYEKITKPLVDAIPPSRVAWVDNILEGKAEADRVIARKEGEGEKEGGGGGGWVLLPDMKWDHRKAAAAVAEAQKEEGEEKEKESSSSSSPSARERAKAATDALYAVLIFADKNLRSLRDVDAQSAPRVAAAVDEAYGVLKERFGVERSSLRAFFHYHPSYWRLHVHFCGALAVPDDGVGRAHLVADVLEAVRARGDWWRERSICVRGFRGDEIAEALLGAGGAAE